MSCCKTTGLAERTWNPSISAAGARRGRTSRSAGSRRRRAPRMRGRTNGARPEDPSLFRQACGGRARRESRRRCGRGMGRPGRKSGASGTRRTDAVEVSGGADDRAKRAQAGVVSAAESVFSRAFEEAENIYSCCATLQLKFFFTSIHLLPSPQSSFLLHSTPRFCPRLSPPLWLIVVSYPPLKPRRTEPTPGYFFGTATAIPSPTSGQF